MAIASPPTERSTLAQLSSSDMVESSADERAASRRLLSVLLVGIALGLTTVALLGPLVSGRIEYHVTETLRNQTIGLDFVSLFVVAPLALLSASLVVRGRVAGPLLALAIGAYTSYMFVQYIVGPDYAHAPGNNEQIFPLALMLFSAGWLVVLLAWRAIDAYRLPRSTRRERLLGRLVLPLLALGAFGRYLPALVDWMSSSPSDSGYLAGPNFSWTIAMLDLGVFLPLTVATCGGLVRGHSWARKALYAVSGWFALVGLAVAAMAVAMEINDDPVSSWGNAIVMCALGSLFVALGVYLYRPMLADRP